LSVRHQTHVVSDQGQSLVFSLMAYPELRLKLSCGSELRTRHDYAFDSEISRCIAVLREAGVPQSIATIDTWWEWCNRASPCHPTNFGEQVAIG